MSQVGVASQNLHEAFPVTTLTILILSLIPCVVILLLLNCLFLAYKLLNISKNKRHKHQQDSEEMLLHSCVSCHRVARITEAPFFQNQGRRIYASMSEPTLPQPVTSSRTSSKERTTGKHGMRFLRPDGATGTGLGSLTAPSTILANSAASGCTSRVDLHRNTKMLNKNKLEWCRSAPLLRQSSDSDVDTRSDNVPPNSPAVDLQDQLSKSLDLIRRSSTLKSLANINNNVGPPCLLDKVELECEYPVHHNSVMMTSCCLNTSMVGPGLDSDFGASAGISLRIVSADSDGLTNGVVAAALEWDYYDPCYVQQNSVPVHKPSRPSIHSKQYWV